MPDREMPHVEVFLNRAGGVTLRQKGEIVALHYSQVPLVVEWLQAVAAAARALETGA